MSGPNGVSLVPPVRRDREPKFANWAISLEITSSDGYRFERRSFTINDGWHENDAIACLDALGMTAASLINAARAAGMDIFGGSALEGFQEGCDPQPVDDNPPAVSITKRA